MPKNMNLKNHALLMALAAVYPVVSYGAGAARVDFAAGSVFAVGSSGQRPLTKGAEVSSGETIRTGNDGRAQLRFSDGAMISLQPQTEFRIDAYEYSGKPDGQEKGFFNLLKGGLRTITGLIGRGNRDAYRVTTQVATIGIRGTEYSVAYTDANNDALLVHTGEGRIEVCNTAGCALVSGGESAFVPGRDRRPERTGNVPLLQPAQPVTSEQVVYAVGEQRTATGGLPPLSAPLVSSTGYAVAFARPAAGVLPDIVFTTSGSATFGSASELQQIIDGSTTYRAGTVTGAFVADGIIGWGVWASGTQSSSLSSFALANMHYVTGMPTPSTDLAGLMTKTGTYELVGYTHPTTSTGLIGSEPISGTLTANFSTTTLISANLTVPVGGTTHNISGNLSGSGVGSFANSSFSPLTCQNCSSASISGFFAGQNASHAGLTYQFSSSNASVGTVSGAAAFRQTSLTP